MEKKQSLSFEQYQYNAQKTNVNPANLTELENITRLTLGLVEESGEVAGKIKKSMRGDYQLEEKKEEIKKELGDVLWYLSTLSDALNLSLNDVAVSNNKKLAERLENNKIKGNGDNR
jgi:NTP pyrophosphatase (non-canonical NTP hydrolase)